jgi:hypothetical protein
MGMGISTTRKQVAVVAASLMASAAWLSVAGPAQATPEEPQSYSHVSASTGVCGWFSQEFTDGFETVNLCGIDGVVVRDGGPEQLAEPLVLIDRYACSLRNGCTDEHHEIVVDRRDFVVDPFLRQATITTTAGACAVEVEFVGTSASTPHGGAWAYHGIQGGPSVDVSSEQTLTRPAQWWGKVCGQLLVAEVGQAQMWRTLAAGTGRYHGGGRHAEQA